MGHATAHCYRPRQENRASGAARSSHENAYNTPGDSALASSTRTMTLTLCIQFRDRYSIFSGQHFMGCKEKEKKSLHDRI